MGLTRRQLPIASPCQEFVGRRATATEPAFCSRCEKSVHDLSRLSEQEVITLLARNIGGRVCVSYRVNAEGKIATRPNPPRFAPAALAVSLAGCAGHLSDADRIASSECIDDAGYGTECPPRPRLADAVIPDATDPTAVEPHAITPDASDPTATKTIDMGARDVVGELPVPLGSNPAPLYPDVAQEVDYDGGIEVPDEATVVRTAGEPMMSAELTRRVHREAKRLERREARKQKRLAKR